MSGGVNLFPFKPFSGPSFALPRAGLYSSNHSGKPSRSIKPPGGSFS